MRINCTHEELEKIVYEDRLIPLYENDPALWVKNNLGIPLWSKQKEMLRAVASHRRNAFYSCHRIGKTFSMALLPLWWIGTNPLGDALVVTSAHSAKQVKYALWRELGRSFELGKSRGVRNLIGRMNQTEWLIELNGREEIVAFGRKPRDFTSLQGTYARKVLVLLDEACFVETDLWDGLDTLVSNRLSKIVAFGNPDDDSTEFAKVCQPGSGWNVIQIGYEDTPNFTDEQIDDSIRESLISREWVEEKKKKWGETNPRYISKVLGKFSPNSSDGLVTTEWVRKAQQYEAPYDSTVNIIGVDVGGGGNKSVIAHRLGNRFRILERNQDANTMHLLGLIITALKETGASVANVDYTGIGKGVVDRSEEMVENRESNWELAAKIIGVRVGGKAENPKDYFNLRAETFWKLRSLFESGLADIDPEEDELPAQLLKLKTRNTGGRSIIESKQEIKVSPDEADAVMLTCITQETDDGLLEIDVTGNLR